MKGNKKTSKRQSAIGMVVFYFSIIALSVMFSVVIDMLGGSSCGQIMKSIGKKEGIIRQKKAELARVQAHWEAMKSTDGLNRALARRGMMMTSAKTDHIIRVDRAGSLQPGQTSVALARRRLAGIASAGYSMNAPRRVR